MPKVKKYFPELRLALGLCLGLTVLGVVALYLTRLKAIPLSQLVPPPKLTKIETPAIFFTSAVFLNRDKTFVSIPYYLADSQQTLWLKLQTPASTPTITRLMVHPTLQSLTWPYLETDGLRLYQKAKGFRSLADFTHNPPTGVTILADPALVSDPRFAEHQLTPLPDDPAQFDLNHVDYILTTYLDSRRDERLSYYETTLDANPAYVSLENMLHWQIAAPLTHSGNPFYLGDIHVDYRQY
ncbi:hypothetical protein A2W24_04880 [Microgenomates group bacterium RBG_16_45_19]|nr:MAG: hypothetical protein A2W24_04880 [Microgenomates group bacterium RBG_16_45_19]